MDAGARRAGTIRMVTARSGSLSGYCPSGQLLEVTFVNRVLADASQELGASESGPVGRGPVAYAAHVQAHRAVDRFVVLRGVGGPRWRTGSSCARFSDAQPSWPVSHPLRELPYTDELETDPRDSGVRP